MALRAASSWSLVVRKSSPVLGTTFKRGFAKKPAKPGTKGGKGSSNASLPFKTHAPVNIFKNGQDPPLKPLSEYPEWVQDLSKPLPGLGELERSVEKAGGLEILSPYLVYRFLKLFNRSRIKQKNQLRAK